MSKLTTDARRAWARLTSAETLARWNPFALLFLASLPAVLPYLREGLPDTRYALTPVFRLFVLDNALRAGVLLPRWSPEMALGYGYPLFNFVPPLPYYLAELFHLAGFDLIGAVKLAIVAATLLSGFGMYLWAHDLTGKLPALVASVFYVYAPFHLVNAYLRPEELGEIWLAPLLPVALWATRRLVRRGGRSHLVAAAFSLAAIVLCQPILAIFFGFFLIAYAVVQAWVTGQWRRLVSVVAALVLALALSSFHWAPALTDFQYVRLSRPDVPQVDFRDNFVQPAELVAPYLPFEYGVPTDKADPRPYHLGWLEIIAAFAALEAWRRGGRRRRAELGALYGLVAYAVFFLSPLSEPVMANLPLLGRIEQPWKLLALSSVATAALAGYVAQWLLSLQRNAREQDSPLGGRAALVLAGLTALILFGSLWELRPLFRWIDPSTINQVTLNDDESYHQRLGTTPAAEYLPLRVKTPPVISPFLQLSPHQRFDALDAASLGPGGEYELQAQNAGRIEYWVRLPAGRRVLFQQLYFSGWRAYVDGVEVQVHPDGPLGLMGCDVPEGEHYVVLRFHDLGLRLLTQALALGISLACLGLLALALSRRVRAPEDAAARPAHDVGFGRAPALVLLGAALVLALWPGRFGLLGQNTLGEVHGLMRDAGASEAQVVDAVLGGKVRLLGYRLEPGFGQPGGALRMTLYWQALEDVRERYAIFFHLLAPPPLFRGVAGAESSYEGLPEATTNWRKGQVYVRAFDMAVPPGTPPGAYRLEVGMFNTQGRAFLPRVTPYGTEIADAIYLPPVRIGRPDAPQPDPLGEMTLAAASFGEDITLVGYTVDHPQVEPGDKLTVTLFWRAKADVLEDLDAFVHVVGADGQTRAQHDSIPADGYYPTSLWRAGDLIRDPHDITIEPGTPPGRYTLGVGLYRPATLERRAVTGTSAPVRENRLTLGEIEVK